LIRYFADQGVHAFSMPLASRGEAGPLLLETAQELGATLLVAGAFGHPRLQRFIFGGTTLTLLESTQSIALFLSH
jgi:nucleotide-binding universal stress UspA family protein